MRSRKLLLFVGLSLAVHLTVWAWLRLTRDAPPRVHGVVEVDFVQSVAHSGEPEPVAVVTPPAKKKRAPEPAAKAAPVSPAASSSAAAPVTGTPGDPNAVRRASDQFLLAVARLIDKSKVYPRDSLRREEEGKVTVGVTLLRDGSLGDTRIEEASPFPSLNDAALKAVRSLRYPPVPETVPAPIHLHVPLQYRLQRD